MFFGVQLQCNYYSFPFIFYFLFSFIYFLYFWNIERVVIRCLSDGDKLNAVDKISKTLERFVFGGTFRQ